MDPLAKALRVEPLEPKTAFGSSGGTALAALTVLDYWRWAFSDVVGNTERGHLGEFIVAKAIGARAELARGWADYDIDAPWGARVEVKTSGYVQKWPQRCPSNISWGIGKTEGWSDDTGLVDPIKRRRADVYVFCLLHVLDKAEFDPLDLNQWTFYVVSTELISQFHDDRDRIGLSAIQKLASPVPLSSVEEAVREASR